MNSLLYALASLAILTALYFLFIRPWTLTWGATREEAARPLPGDDIVKKTHFVATRAVAIHASPSEVWRWIVQIGSARAGWYSIDWIDNGGKESSRTILPDFQMIENNYFIPFTPDRKNGMWVKEFKEPETILWWDKKGDASWLWHLSKTEQGDTRLLTRLRTKYDFKFPWVIYYILYDLGDIVMMSKCMLGIKERAEKRI
jgi:hypothetical protein